MPPSSTRYPRDHFSVKLAKLCRRLDSKSSGEADAYWVDQVWAVGSWARGAPLCGDLDLVVSLGGRGDNYKTLSQLASPILGRQRGVEVHFGVPGDNTSGVAFRDQVLIWSRQGNNWQSAIDDVPIDPNATRAPRQWDALPFDYKDFSGCMSNDALRKVIDLEQKGIIRWTVHTLPKPQESWPEGERPAHIARAELLMRGWGPERRTSMLAMIDYVATGFPNQRDRYLQLSEEFREMEMGGLVLRVGPLYINPDWLDGKFEGRAFGLAKLWSKSKPNLLWMIERGPNHPINRAFEDIEAWTLWHAARDEASCETWVFPHQQEGGADFMHLFTTRREAAAAIRLLEDEDLAEPGSLLPKLLRGQELLDWLSCMDGVELKQQSTLALTNLGQRCAGLDDEDRVTLAGLRDILAPKCRIKASATQ